MPDAKTIQDRHPNWRSEGRLYLVRCFACPDAGERGRENWAALVAAGTCAWCGWEEPNDA